MGKSCPTMNEAIEQVGLDGILKGFMLETKSRNLEDIYSELFRRGDECFDSPPLATTRPKAVLVQSHLSC